MFLLDTNAVIAVLTERLPAVAQRFDEEIARRSKILLSTVVLYELRYGIAKSARRTQSEAILSSFLELPLEIVSFDAEDSAQAGEIRADLAAKGTPIGPYDVMIASQARRRGAVLVTGNRREFDRVSGLVVTDWSAS